MITVVAALGACRQTADAEPAPARSGLAAPAGWQSLPNLAGAITTAAHDRNMAIDGAEAWGETAMGCYAVWLAMSGGSAGADVLADQVLAGMGVAKLTVADVVKPAAAGGVMSLRFDRAPYRGRLRAELATGRITAVACFANGREPVACDAACTTWIGAMR
jgi:hypothetical protein